MAKRKHSRVRGTLACSGIGVQGMIQADTGVAAVVLKVGLTDGTYLGIPIALEKAEWLHGALGQAIRDVKGEGREATAVVLGGDSPPFCPFDTAEECDEEDCPVHGPDAQPEVGA